ncbi:hypothetical protein [Psychroserpens sp. MEBiC05023]
MKKTSKNLKTLLKISLVIIVLFFSSCDKRCNREELKIYKAAEEGNLEVVKNYLENGGNLLLDCYDGTSGGFNPYGAGLYFSICKSNSKELITFYLKQDLPQEVKNEMFHYFLADKNEALLRLVIKNNGHAFFGKKCFGFDLTEQLVPLKKAGYDFNWIDPSDGNNIVMNYALCEATYEGADDEILKTIKFLVEEVGVRTDIKNKDGKTAKELAVNPKIKAYLESL